MRRVLRAFGAKERVRVGAKAAARLVELTQLSERRLQLGEQLLAHAHLLRDALLECGALVGQPVELLDRAPRVAPHRRQRSGERPLHCGELLL
eukprot:scaffold62697_cov57-Phaeocystis_antarctica.AAC.2